ncbi:MAG: CheW-like protein [bacterium]|nr:MAG: CheW-like protein [bacterium]
MRVKKIKRDLSKTFSWDDLHKKMSELSIALSHKLDENKLSAILNERAELLANLVDTEQETENNALDVLVFEFGEEQYAIDAVYISEVIPLKLLTRVPGAPDFILGVVSRRGEIISVIDFGRFAGLSETQTCQHLIFVENQGTQIGIAVHRLKEITQIPHNSIQAVQTQWSGEQAQHLKGVTELGIALLDVKEILSCEKLNFDV